MDTNSKIFKDRFIEYVKISSESGREKEMCDKVFSELKFEASKHKANNYTTDGYNIYAYIKGDIPGDPILFNAHLDTVKPGLNIKPIVEDNIIKSDGSTILGADDKAGVVAIMSALDTIKTKSHRDIEVLFTVGEEAGLCGSKGFDCSILKSKFGYVFDSSNECGAMIFKSPYKVLMTINVHGKPAHAGRAPENGISAIQTAAKAIAEIPLLRVDSDTTCNIGTFESIGSANVVSDKAKIILEVRSFIEEKLERQVKRVLEAFDKYCDFDYEIEKVYSGYSKNEDFTSVKYAKKIMKKLNIKPFSLTAGSASDGNILNDYGMDILNLGIGSKNVHTLEETLDINELVKLHKLIVGLMTGEDK